MKILTSAGNILDVKNLVQVIEIFEDINSPALTGSLTLLDIDNILDELDISKTKAHYVARNQMR